MEIEKLNESLAAKDTEIESLKAEVETLKLAEAERKARDERLDEIRNAGIDPTSLKESLLNAILAADEDGASAIIETLRESPASAPASEPVEGPKNTDDICAFLEG